MRKNKIYSLIESLCRVPEQNRCFTARFLLVTFCGLIGLILLSVFIAPLLDRLNSGQNILEESILNIIGILWLCIGVRYAVLAARMKKVPDFLGVLCIGFFSFLIVYILSQGA